MDTIMDAFLNGLFATSHTVELGVTLPAGHDPMELYQILKNSLDASGCSLTSFEVKKDNA